MFVINSNSDKMQPQTCIKLNDTKILALIDSGAALNIISESVFNAMTPHQQLTTVSVKIHPYGCTNPLPIAGAFNCDIEAGNKKTKGMFYMLEGWSSSDRLRNSSRAWPDQNSHQRLLHKWPNSGGRADGQLSRTLRGNRQTERLSSQATLFKKDFQVRLNKDVQTTCQPHRRVLFQIRKKVEDELTKLENENIIETVTGPTPWVSPIVKPPKTERPR